MPSRALSRHVYSIIWLVVAVVAVGLPIVIPHPARAAAVGDSVDQALAQAAATDEPVPIPDRTTAYSITDALPDGTLQSTFNPEPVRVQRNGTWQPVDASLVRNDDGTYSPAVTPNQLRLSAGGTEPLARMSNGAASLALSWPTALPTPTLSGPTATYADVLPGVDLAVTASRQGGLSEVLIVKTATAAANPALATLRLATSTSGLSLNDDPDGNIEGTDSAGNALLYAARPIMWDSPGGTDTSTAPQANAIAADTSTDSDASANGESGPPPGAQTAPVDVDVSASAVTLTPDQDLLTGSDTGYPVYIDPGFVWRPGNGSDNGWDWVQQALPNTSWWEDLSNGHPAVGYQGWEADFQGKNRSFWQFDIGTIGSGDTLIHTATLNVPQVYSGDATCSNEHRIDVYNAGRLYPSSTWNDQPSVSTLLDYKNVPSCTPPTQQFNVASAISSDANGIVDFRLSAHDETSKWFYKRFAGWDTTLVITYDTRPSVPTSLKTTPALQNNAGDCRTTNGWLNGQSTNITFTATVNDPDLNATTQTVRADFDVWDKGTDGTATSPQIVNPDSDAGQSALYSSSQPASIQVPHSTFISGHRYGWDAFGDDQEMKTGQSDHCYFWYDANNPAIHATTSTDFTLTGSPKHAGEAGTFHLTATDVTPTGGGKYSGIDHFVWSPSSAAALANDGGNHIDATTSGADGSADITYTPTVWGINYLYVAAVDRAGNQSATTTYKYYAPDNPNATVAPGDVDGDGRPDLVATDSSTGTLEVISGDPANPVTPVIASDATNSPDGVSWNGAITAHRSSTGHSTSGGRVDDLWALKNPATTHDPNAGTQFYLYINNLNNAGGLAGHNGLYYTGADARYPVPRPTCLADNNPANACDSYGPDWSTTSQIIADGDVTGDGNPDLITVEQGRLWLFEGTTTTARLTDPRQIGASGWDNWRIIAPGDSTGDGLPDIWAATATTTGTGAIRLYAMNRTCDTGGNCSYSLAAPIENTTADWGPDTRRLVASPGDADGDGTPDLYTIFTSSPEQLLTNRGAGLSPTTFTFYGHGVVDDGTTINWSHITNLS